MSETKGMDRRNFLKSSALGVVGAGVAGSSMVMGQETKKETGGGMPKVHEYRMLGKTGFKVSDISIGGVTKVEVINAMLDAGVNYIDTAETYSRGQSEISMGQAIKGRDRKKLFINTKLHIKEDETKESILERFNKCLKRLDTSYVDSLMTHNPGTIAMARYEPFFAACKQLQDEGKLRFVGISSHGNRHGGKQDSMEDVLLEATKDSRYAVMLLVYNFIQAKPAEKVMAACKQKNIGVTLMKTNPVGRFLSMKERVEGIKKAGGPKSDRDKRTLAYFETLKKAAEEGDWFIKKYKLDNPAEIRIAATRFGLTHPQVATVLARTDTFDDMEQFLKASGTTLSDMEAKKLSAFKKGPGKMYCRHACGICESSCPGKVPVNTIMRYNHYFEAQGQEKMAIEKYAALQTNRADMCAACEGSCEAHCPFGVPVQGLLTMAHENLSFGIA